MTNKQLILIGAGVLVVFLIIGGIFFAIGARGNNAGANPTPTPTPSIEVTGEPTPFVTEAPTVTPTRSVTPTRAATPTPSRTPAPTATITPTPSPTPAPGVVNIEASVTPTTSNTCTQKYTFSAKIYTNGAATVKYKWLRSDNAISPEQSITFTEAGMQTVTTEWTRGPITSGTTEGGWQRIEILSPGSGLGNKAEFTLSCP